MPLSKAQRARQKEVEANRQLNLASMAHALQEELGASIDLSLKRALWWEFFSDPATPLERQFFEQLVEYEFEEIGRLEGMVHES